jgi:CheY-like chemotaxis protein
VRDLVRIMLEASGYRVIAAAGPAEAERVCEAHRDAIDLLLTDLVMPGMNGRALAERLAELSPATRILFMSGYSDEAVHHHGVIRQESAFVEKPFTALTLTRMVRELLDRPL